MKLNLTNEEAIEQLRLINAFIGYDKDSYVVKRMQAALDMAIKALEQTSWIPVSERLPEDLEAVNIIWVNHEPEPYYHEIKDKNFIATGIHFRGKWYWYSTTCADYLGAYGENEFDMVDDAIEIIAWMPLPQPYKAESEDKG